jgi:hypothetical protein
MIDRQQGFRSRRDFGDGIEKWQEDIGWVPSVKVSLMQIISSSGHSHAVLVYRIKTD